MSTLHDRLAALGWSEQLIALSLKVVGSERLAELYPEPEPEPPAVPPRRLDDPDAAERAMRLAHCGGRSIRLPVRSRRTDRPIPPPPPPRRKRTGKRTR